MWRSHQVNPDAGNDVAILTAVFRGIRDHSFKRAGSISELEVSQDSAQNPTSIHDMATQKPTVLVLGGTGRTGRSIVDGLLKSGDFVRAPLPPFCTA